MFHQMLAKSCVVFVVIIAALGCTHRSDTPSTTSVSESSKRPSMAPVPTITVSAAASMQDVLKELGEEFKASHDCEIRWNIGASSSLANQIVAGAPADLFISASTEWADVVDKGGFAKKRKDLLTNRLILVVPPTNPANVMQPSDLLRQKVSKIALAGENVPAGIYATQALEQLNILKPLEQLKKIVRGQDVRTALGYVERGEAEAGIVYASDVAVSHVVDTVHEFDPELHDKIVYVLVMMKQTSNELTVEAFYNYLIDPARDAIYRKYGFRR